MMTKILLAAVLLLSAFTTVADARVRIDISNPNAEPLPLGIPVFHPETPADAALAQEIADVIKGNFDNSSLFSVVNRLAYTQTPAALSANGPDYTAWQSINTDAVLSATVKRLVQDGKEKVRVDFRLYDTQDQKQLVGRRYTVDTKFARHVGHRISDDIYSTLTGEDGYFATRIVHIGESKGFDGQIAKKLCVMDQDGANYQCLTDASHLVLTPRFNKGLQKIIYLSYANGLPRLYLLDLPTGEQTIVGDFKGLNSSPRFAPDNQTIAMTLTQGHEGNPEIYTMDLTTRKLKRLTNHRAIDTSPSFSPDGKKVVFNSDRGGRPALYVMNSDGSGVKRLTFGKGSYYAPVWSPRGDLIAFTKSLGSTFHIGVVETDGSEERLLTDSYLDESPTWSPNGRVISFARQFPRENKTKIMTIDLTGFNLRELPTPTAASDPAWSPLIK